VISLTINVLIWKFIYDKLWGLAYRILTIEGNNGHIYMPPSNYLAYQKISTSNLDCGDTTIEMDIFTNDANIAIDDDIYAFSMYEHTSDNIFFLDKDTYRSIRNNKVARRWAAFPARYMRAEVMELNGDRVDISEIFNDHIVKGTDSIKPNSVLKRKNNGDEYFEEFDMPRFMKNAHGNSET